MSPTPDDDLSAPNRDGDDQMASDTTTRTDGRDPATDEKPAVGAEGAAGVTAEDAERGRAPWRRLIPAWALGLLVLAVVAAGGAWWFTTHSGLPDGAVLQVADEVVTDDDYRERQAAFKAMYGIEAPTGDDAAAFRRDAAKSIAVGLVLEDAARERGVTVSATNVDATLTSYVESFFGVGEEGATRYLDALGQAGASEEDVRTEVSRQLLVARLFQDVTTDVEPATDDEVRQAFAERRCDLQKPEQRELRNIVVPTRREAAAIRNGIARGVPFTQLTLKRSIDQATRTKGGSLGLLAAEDLEPDYAAEAFSVPRGEYFGPVESQYGWNVGQVVRVVAAGQASFEETRVPLAELLVDERRSAVWRTWLEEQLVAADVEYADEYRPDDPTAPPALDTELSAAGVGDGAASCGGS